MKWEYKFVTIKVVLTEAAADVIEKRLGVLGEEGWEAVGFSYRVNRNVFMALLKRPKK